MRFRHVLRKNILYYLCGKFKHVTDGFHTRRAGGEGPRSVSAGIQLLAVRVFGLQRPAGGRIDTRCDDLGAAGRRHGTAAGGVRGCERHVAHRRFLAPCPDPAVRQAKAATYALVQEFAERFRAENGAIVCRELLGLACRKEEPVPAERTAEYYKKRPCVELVACAARIVGEYLQRQNAAPEE